MHTAGRMWTRICGCFNRLPVFPALVPDIIISNTISHTFLIIMRSAGLYCLAKIIFFIIKCHIGIYSAHEYSQDNTGLEHASESIITGGPDSVPHSGRSTVPNRLSSLEMNAAPSLLNEPQAGGNGQPSCKRQLHEAEKEPEQPCKRKRCESLPKKNVQPTLCSYFLATSLKERLDFLSWLFKYGLSQSMSEASQELPFEQGEMVDKPPGSPQPHHPVIAPDNSCAITARSRKGKAWTAEEIKLLIRLKKQNLP